MNVGATAAIAIGQERLPLGRGVAQYLVDTGPLEWAKDAATANHAAAHHSPHHGDGLGNPLDQVLNDRQMSFDFGQQFIGAPRQAH